MQNLVSFLIHSLKYKQIAKIVAEIKEDFLMFYIKLHLTIFFYLYCPTLNLVYFWEWETVNPRKVSEQEFF